MGKEISEFIGKGDRMTCKKCGIKLDPNTVGMYAVVGETGAYCRDCYYGFQGSNQTAIKEVET